MEHKNNININSNTREEGNGKGDNIGYLRVTQGPTGKLFAECLALIT